MPYRNIDPTLISSKGRITSKELRLLKSKPSTIEQNNPTKKKKSKPSTFMVSITEWKDLFSKAIHDYLKHSGLRTKNDLEYYEQVKFFYYVACKYPDLRYRIHASPNGGSRKGSYEGHRFNAAGLSKGWPDVEILSMRSGYGALFIEFKSQMCDYKNEIAALKEVKDHQHKHRLSLLSEGYLAVVCYGAEEAILVLDAYMIGTPIPSYILSRWN